VAERAEPTHPGAGKLLSIRNFQDILAFVYHQEGRTEISYVQENLSIIAAGGIALGAMSVAAPADAAARFGVYVGPTYSQPPSGPRQCWAWSRQVHDWIWVCQRYSQRHDLYRPYADNYNAGPSFSFSFGTGNFSGDRHHHMH
jgi:hypothetical protein